MSNPIFREKSLEKVKSPDNLNEYIRISSPSVWLLLASVIILLVGFCIWGFFGQLQTVVEARAICADGLITCQLSDQDIVSVQPGMKVSIGSQNGTVAEVLVRSDNQSQCTISMPTALEDGTYTVQIEVENIHPASFLLN